MGARLGPTIKDVIRGDTRRVNATFLDSDGDPIVLTGGTAYFTVNAASDPASDGSAVIQKVATGATPFTGPLVGQHTFVLSHTDTNITPGTYWYDIQFVDGVGNYVSGYRGKFILQSDITRT